MTTSIADRQVPTLIEQAKADLIAAGYDVTDGFPKTMPVTAHLHIGRFDVGVVLCDPDFGQHVGVTESSSVDASKKLLLTDDVQVIDGRLIPLDIQHAVASAVSLAAAIGIVTKAGVQ